MSYRVTLKVSEIGWSPAKPCREISTVGIVPFLGAASASARQRQSSSQKYGGTGGGTTIVKKDCENVTCLRDYGAANPVCVVVEGLRHARHQLTGRRSGGPKELRSLPW